VQDTRNACEALKEYGTPSEIKQLANSYAPAIETLRKEAFRDRKLARNDMNRINKIIERAESANDGENALVDFTESFQIPDDAGQAC